MTKLKLLTLLALLPLTATAGISYPKTVPQSVQCGVPPLPPAGCGFESAVCLCATSGQCQWVFLGCR